MCARQARSSIRSSSTCRSGRSGSSGTPPIRATVSCRTAFRRRHFRASRAWASRSRRIRSAWSVHTSLARRRAGACSPRCGSSAMRRRARVRGVAGYSGFFYHFLDMKTGQRFEDSELSTVDTAILLAGALFCQSYFDGAEAEEAEIRRLADEIYRRVDWRWAQPHAPAISLGWSPEDGFLRIRLARLQRGDAGVHAGAGLADLRGWQGSLGRVDEHLRQELGQGLRAGASRVSAAVRPSVPAGLDRLPRHPGRLHAPARHRLFREQPARRLRAARLRDRQSRELQGLRREDLGDHGERRTGRHRAQG